MESRDLPLLAFKAPVTVAIRDVHLIFQFVVMGSSSEEEDEIEIKLDEEVKEADADTKENGVEVYLYVFLMEYH